MSNDPGSYKVDGLAGSPRNLIFLCHASEDKAIVQKVYRRLQQENLRPWLDKIDLRPGQDWRREIQRAIRSSQFVIVFISKTSLSKRGFVQKEVKIVLDTLDEIPEGEVFVIPVRLDECDIPDRLSHLHYADYFSDVDLEHIVSAVSSDDRSAASTSASSLTLDRTRTVEELASTRGLRILTQRTQYTSFLLVNPDICPVPAIVPHHSFVHEEPGLVSSIAGDLKSIGIELESYPDRIPPHLADGEVIVDFTAVNEGPTTVISHVELEVLEVVDVPPLSLPGQFWPILQPIEDFAILSTSPLTYRLFKNKVLAYKAGDVDLFRVSVRIADDEAPSIFAYRFNFHCRTTTGTERLASSEVLYLAKVAYGPANRAPVQKKQLREDEAADAYRTALNSTESRVPTRVLPDFWTREGFLDRLVEFSNCKQREFRDPYQFIVANYADGVLAGPRDNVQRDGFEHHDYGRQGSTFEPIFIEVNPTAELGYDSDHYSNVTIYEKRSTPEYGCLALACKQLDCTGSMRSKLAASEFLVDQVRHVLQNRTARSVRSFVSRILPVKATMPSRQPHIDAAAFIDTLHLLSLLRNTVSYDFLSLALRLDHEVIRARAAEAFVGVRYHGAEHGLLEILDSNRTYATERALAALALNGSPSCTDKIVAACDGLRLVEEDADLVANVLVEISRQLAQTIAVKYSTHGSPTLKRVSFHILDILRDGCTGDTYR